MGGIRFCVLRLFKVWSDESDSDTKGSLALTPEIADNSATAATKINIKKW